MEGVAARAGHAGLRGAIHDARILTHRPFASGNGGA